MEKKQNKNWLGTAITLAVVAASVWVYYNYYRSQPNEYVTFYNTVKGLQTSSPVTIKGVKVGKIKHIEIQTDGLVKVTLSIKEGIAIPDSSQALLTSGGLVSDKSITIIEGNCKTYMQQGDTLLSDADNSMTASIQVTPFMETLKYLLYTADTSLSSINKLMLQSLQTNFVTPLQRFDKTLNDYEMSSAKLAKTDVANTLKQANKQSLQIANSSKEWKQNLHGLDTQTKHLADKNMKANMASIGNNIRSLRNSVANITHPDSPIGKMATDKSAYRNTSAQLDTASNSMQALKDNPPSFSIFGKSKKKK